MSNAKNPQRKTKAASINSMPRRERGATLAEMEKASGWKSHSCRAFLSGVRKTGATVVKEERPDGKTAYRVTAEVQ
ncbi:DUF3489 domain-containing protein [Altererythrobacter salegens]|uniref:DUF3489 domain-containing protein n=1 Tax=Croceibacterium salegens TaxID=1737568 RepID=A0A6I4SU58_9SPHN|nr:DUF3489 domain-containing protein [Croceibacterium salegens]MXO58480.1 DUF3489 domain-containing protein [Croceibacterium salegens]